MTDAELAKEISSIRRHIDLVLDMIFLADYYRETVKPEIHKAAAKGRRVLWLKDDSQKRLKAISAWSRLEGFKTELTETKEGKWLCIEW